MYWHHAPTDTLAVVEGDGTLGLRMYSGEELRTAVTAPRTVCPRTEE